MARVRSIGDRVWSVSSFMVSFYLYTDGDTTIAIDTGSSPAAARRAVARAGLDPLRIGQVFLTHSDGDHVGGAAAFPEAAFHLSRAEEPLASGEKLRRILFLRHANHAPSPRVLLDDGQVVAAGSLRVRCIATPGHTVGSMSYLVNDEALFTGDLISLHDGVARSSSPIITEDPAEDARSIRRLGLLVSSARLLCTGHTGHTADYARAMAGWRP